MSKPVLSFSMGEPASDALALMRDEQVRHAVVLHGNKLVGVVSEHDLGGPRGGALRVRHFLADLMQTPIVIGPDVDVWRAAEVMLDHRIGCLPVVERGRVVGILTRSDLLRAAFSEHGGPPPVAERMPRIGSLRDKRP